MGAKTRPPIELHPGGVMVFQCVFFAIGAIIGLWALISLISALIQAIPRKAFTKPFRILFSKGKSQKNQP